MRSLKTTYMGLELKNPLILGSSPMISDLDSIKRAEDSGLAAIVLNSLFEEQITKSAGKDMSGAEDYLTHADARAFLSQASADYYVDKYLELIEKAKSSVDIPIIACINCTSEARWLDDAKSFATCGADAIEVIHFIVPSNSKVPGPKVEANYLKFAQQTRKAISLPLSMKISYHFTSISNMVKSLSDLGIDGIVMFNHLFRPDINIDKVCVDSTMLQPKGDYGDTLRWTAIMSSVVKSDICASTGIRDASTVIKMLLAGAKATQISSTIFMHGFPVVKEILSGIEEWMDKHNYNSIEDFRGLLSQDKIGDPQSWERSIILELSSSFRNN
jgi:dihydroorotate dehydrogenase (fumarate)